MQMLDGLCISFSAVSCEEPITESHVHVALVVCYIFDAALIVQALSAFIHRTALALVLSSYLLLIILAPSSAVPFALLARMLFWFPLSLKARRLPQRICINFDAPSQTQAFNALFTPSTLHFFLSHHSYSLSLFSFLLSQCFFLFNSLLYFSLSNSVISLSYAFYLMPRLFESLCLKAYSSLRAEKAQSEGRKYT